VPTDSEKAEIRQSTIDFLDAAQSMSRKQLRCVHCGSSMLAFDAHFLLYESGRQWKIPVPFCPACDQEDVKVLASALQYPLTS